MTDNERELLAAQYVLGTLETDERAQLEARLQSDSVLRAAVSRWMDDLAALEPPSTELSAPATTWHAIESAIQNVFPAGTVTHHVEGAAWNVIAPGVQQMMLHQDSEAGIQCYLLRLEPGAQLPEHGHRIAEECLVLEGELQIGEVRVGPGDFHLARAGTTHPALRAQVATLVYLRGEIRPGS